MLLLYGNVGTCEEVNSGRVVAELNKMAKRYKDIAVHINSNGGEVYEGIALYNSLRTCKANLTIYIDGIAASIAAVMALCGRKVYMNRNARIMLHRVSCGGWGNAEDLKSIAAQCESLEDSISAMISTRCGKSPEEVKKDYFDGRDHWFTAEQALSAGMIDGIVEASIPDMPGERPSAHASNDEIYQYTNRVAEAYSQHVINMAFIDDLKKKSSFSGCNTEEEMMVKINSLENEAVQVSALKAKVAELNGKIDLQIRKRHEETVDAAIADGRIVKEQREIYLNLLKADEASALKALEALPKRPAASSVEKFLSNITHTSTGSDLASMSWEEIDKAERLNELKEKYPDLYQAKFDEYFK